MKYFDHAGVELHWGDARDVLATVPDKSVHCVVTSPPYYGLRDYGTAQWDGGDPACDHAPDMTSRGARPRGKLSSGTKHIDEATKAALHVDVCAKCGAVRVDKQIGLERTPEQYVEGLVAILMDVHRVLRDDGTLWLNLGDSYSRGMQGRTDHGSKEGSVGLGGNTNGATAPGPVAARKPPAGVPSKQLLGIPWRVAFALQDAGWILRSDIIWCLSGTTDVYVRTKKGDAHAWRETHMCIKDLARHDPARVQLWNGTKWTTLLGVSRTPRTGEEVTIRLRSGERISCTPAHRFPTNRGLLAASELRVGDILERVRLPEPEQPCAPQQIGEDAAWFVGLYVAEGSRSGSTIQITGHAREGERWERIQRITDAYGGTCARTIHGNTMNIRVYGKVLNAIIDQFVSGKLAKGKHFDPVCWKYSDRFLGEMLDGYLSGDGSWDEVNKCWGLGFTRNYYLARDMRVLCARLGYHLILNRSVVKYNGKGRLGFNGKIRMFRSGHHNQRESAEVMSIELARGSGSTEMFDIGVEDEPHVFALASGILTHNSKPNVIPESVTDRPTKSHEHLFLLAKRERYYYDRMAIAEKAIYAGQHANKTTSWGTNRKHPNKGNVADYAYKGDNHTTLEGGMRNKRDVWSINTIAYHEAHYAVFPPALVEPCILAGTSAKGCCPQCGAPWRRIIERDAEMPDVDPSELDRYGTGEAGIHRKIGSEHQRFLDEHPPKTVGWEPTCTCGVEETVPCTVLDPFAGSGTTLMVAAKRRRRAVGIDLSAESCELATWRIMGKAKGDALVASARAEAV